MKNAIFACVQAVKGCVSCSLCMAEEINVAFNPDQLKKKMLT